MALGDQDIESFKHAHESNTEWALRKRFLEAHQEKYSLNRLVCLASCFINIECYGCRYPGPVMEEINGLMQEIMEDVEHFRKEVKSINQIKFVKASDSDDKSSDSSGVHQQLSMVPRAGSSKQPDYSKPMTFVKSSASAGSSTSDEPTRPGLGLAFVKAADDYHSTDVTEHAGSMAEPTPATQAAEKSNPFGSWSRSNDEWQGGANLGRNASIGSSNIKSITEPVASSGGAPKASPFARFLSDGGGSRGGLNTGTASPARVSNVVPKSQPAGMPSQQDVTFLALSEKLEEVCRSSLPHSDNPISALHMVMDISPVPIDIDMVPSQGGFTCSILIDHVHVGQATAYSKKNAKTAAYADAVALMRKPNLRVVQVGPGRQELRSAAQRRPFNISNDSRSTFEPKRSRYENQPRQSGSRGGVRGRGRGRGGRMSLPPAPPPPVKNLDEFIIIQHILSVSTATSTSILHQSSEFNKMPVQYDFREELQGQKYNFHCTLSLGPHTVASVDAPQKLGAKHLAAETALANLREKCWTIQIKQAADADDGYGVSRDEFIGNLQKEVTAIPDSNIGSKLLKMMGWEGGGIGKDGTGIAEPVKVNTVINREGLGLQTEKGISKDFLPRVKKIIMDYASSERQDDLVFSPDFSKDERALAHKEAQRLGLKTHSHGSGAQRHLVISRRRTANQLFSHILQSGGETNKYVLLPPGSNLSPV